MELVGKKVHDCEYCSGEGYFQLLLGGTETCPCCKGSGKKEVVA